MGRLVLTRHLDEVVILDCQGVLIEVMVVEAGYGRARLSFTATREVAIWREEIWQKIQQARTSAPPDRELREPRTP
jgi:carbon storage regulator CsrA